MEESHEQQAHNKDNSAHKRQSNSATYEIQPDQWTFSEYFGEALKLESWYRKEKIVRQPHFEAYKILKN